MRKVIKNDVTCTKLILINLDIKKTTISCICDIFEGQFSPVPVAINYEQKLHTIISIFPILKFKNDESYRTHDDVK